MTDEPKPLTEEELAKWELYAYGDQRVENIPGATPTIKAENVLRLVAEVRRLRALATCEACAKGYRRAPDGLHYDDERGGSTWGICRSQVLRSERAELLRLRAEANR